MLVKQFKFKVPDIVSGTSVNIPIGMNFIPSDQSETVEMDFVEKEIAESINVITDYEKARFTPTYDNGTTVKVASQVQYHINLLDGGTFPTTTMCSHAGFTRDDLKFRRNKFVRSFIRLAFYDSDITTNQNLMSFMTLFCRITTEDTVPLETNGVPNDDGGLPYPANQIPLRFVIQDPISNPDGVSEGYFLYHYKDEVDVSLPKELYMRASWNNAATGESLPLITDPTPQSIDNLISKLHMKYILKRDNTGYYYEIDPTYSSPQNITILSGDIVSVQLYQIQVL